MAEPYAKQKGGIKKGGDKKGGNKKGGGREEIRGEGDSIWLFFVYGASASP